VARDLFTVDPGPVPAVQVFEDVLAVLRDDAGVIAGRAVIAQHQMIIGVPAQQERQRIDTHPRALARGMQNQEPGRRRPGECNCRLH